MSGVYAEHVVRDLSAAHEAAELFHGTMAPSELEVPVLWSADYMRERSALSAVLVAHAVEHIVIEDDSLLGYRFIEQPGANLRTNEDVQKWVQQMGHSALDDVIARGRHVAAIAQRYQDLIRPRDLPGQLPSADDRRETIMFHGAVFEPHAWLKMGSIAAKYYNKEIRPDQALPFVLGKLPVIQQSARRDVALQDIRVAILEAAIALGEMRTPGNPTDSTNRYRLLSTYVLAKEHHKLAAPKFGKLYDVADDPLRGVTLTEKPAGFGPIKPKREVPFGCPAAYRLSDPTAEAPNGEKSALFKLLRASINTLVELDILKEALVSPRASVAEAHKLLNQKLATAGRGQIG